MTEIVRTDDVFGGAPRIDGRRISVRHIGGLYVDGGMEPETIADQLDLTLAEVHTALAYYYEHPDEMAAMDERTEALLEELAERSEAPDAIEQ